MSLEETDLLNNALVVDCQSEEEDELTLYCNKLRTYLSNLVRSDETGYIRKAIEERKKLAEFLYSPDVLDYTQVGAA